MEGTLPDMLSLVCVTAMTLVLFLHAELQPKLAQFLYELSTQHPQELQAASHALDPEQLDILNKTIQYITASLTNNVGGAGGQ